ncbi:hypothetical protein HY793_01745, partial [Candidatus Desantisbacteria bacterium]|nr:hypothetical protein [Candidatus Desantisbacteria bacterium]
IPNKNPQEDEPLYNITINTISQIEYRINNNSWSSATALDGIFDEPEEEFTFTPSTLSYGTHTFSVRAIDSVWNVSNYSTDTLTIYMEKMQATGLMIDPATITVTTGNTVEYNGTARDTAGNTWTVTGATAFSIGDPWGTITGNVYTAGKVGTWTIIGNHAGLFATATVIITQDILHHIVIEPDMAVVQIQGKQVFCAGGYDQYDNYLPGILFDWTVEDGLGDLSSSYDTQTTLTAGKFITSGRIIASNNGISGYATVTITSGELGYFQFERIDNQQAGDEFPITITAHDRYHNLIDTFIDAVDLSDVTGSIMPQHTGRFINGSWSGMVTIDKLWLGTNITAKYQEICGTSSNFSSLIDDDIGTSTVGSVTIRFNPCDINGTDYLFIITPDVSSPAIERANKEIQQHPRVKQMLLESRSMYLLSGNGL